MKVGVFDTGPLPDAWRSIQHDVIDLSETVRTQNGSTILDTPSRFHSGREIVIKTTGRGIELLSDIDGRGLGFVGDPKSGKNVRIAHEAAGKLLASYMQQPITRAFAGCSLPEIWQSLNSQSWFKFVTDQAHAYELEQLGLPGVFHLPPAAPIRDYDTTLIAGHSTRPALTFVGDSTEDFFASTAPIRGSDVLPGTMAHVVGTELEGTTFYDIYFNLYCLGIPVTLQDDLATRMKKVAAYFQAKKFYETARRVTHRDRFVIFASRNLTDCFQLLGQGWNESYGLKSLPAPQTVRDRLDLFRRSTINLQLGGVGCESGLHTGHFEITAAGGFMLAYDLPELHQFFEIGTECAVFRDEQELLEKVRYYSAHPEQRVAIARAGQQRTLSQHLYSHRIQKMLATLQSRHRRPDVTFSSTSVRDDLKTAVPDANIIFDCGANVGQSAGMLRELYPHAEIYSFEPVKKAFQQLQEKCRALNVTPIRLAVSNHDGLAKMHLTASGECHSLLAFQEHNPCAKWTRVIGTEQVETCTLDRWCEQNGIDPRRIDVIKLDVQGGELRALQGATNTLKHARAVFLEVSFIQLYKDAPLFPEIERFMSQSGYKRSALYPSDQPQNWGDALYVRTISQVSDHRSDRCQPVGNALDIL